MEGDPHITTVGGVRYDFQGAGEYVSLRDYDGLEIQTRQTPIATTFNPGPDAHDGLATCVSLNTAVAARVGRHRISYQPNISGVPDPSGLQLRVDGTLQTLPANGIDLGNGGRVLKGPSGNGIQVDFPDGTALMVTPNWWPSQSKWYLNVDAFNTPAILGIMGPMSHGSWLPALPDGTSMGPMPGAMHQRYVDLYHKFGNAWRVTDKTSLFDYAPGTSTKTFILASWPLENPPCVIPETPPVKPADPRVAEEACRVVTDKETHRNCVFDVTVTGELGFAKAYLASQRIRAGATNTTVSGNKDVTRPEEPAVFTAIVMRMAPTSRAIPAGTVQFTVDGAKAGEPVKLNANGQALWRTNTLKPGKHSVAASYVPAQSSVFLPSTSTDTLHVVRSGEPGKLQSAVHSKSSARGCHPRADAAFGELRDDAVQETGCVRDGGGFSPSARGLRPASGRFEMTMLEDELFRSGKARYRGPESAGSRSSGHPDFASGYGVHAN